VIDRQFVRGVIEKVVANAVWAIILAVLSLGGTILGAATGRLALAGLCGGALVALCLVFVPAYVSVARDRKRQNEITCQIG
jgi:TRAP-type C4-dicarboxylate transport system permease large subunit